MKNILVVLAILLVFCSSAGAATYVFQFNDAVNPTAGTILVNTGALNEGSPSVTIYKVFVQAYSSANATLAFRLKDASAVVVGTYKFIVPANNRGLFGEPTMQFDIPNDYSLEIVAGANITGTLHGAIFMEPISGY